MYCVNGQAPYFKTLQEARCHAIRLKDYLDEERQGGLYKAVADIYDDEKNLVGTVLSPPDGVFTDEDSEARKLGMGGGMYYLKAGTTVIQLINSCDGSLSDMFKKDFVVENNRFRVPYKDGELPFLTIEEARTFLYGIFSSENAVIDAGSPIQDVSGKTLGFVVRYDENTVIYGIGRKWKEVFPNGRLGKAIKVRYGSAMLREETLKVHWKGPAVIKDNVPKKYIDLCNKVQELTGAVKKGE